MYDAVRGLALPLTRHRRPPHQNTTRLQGVVHELIGDRSPACRGRIQAKGAAQEMVRPLTRSGRSHDRTRRLGGPQVETADVGVRRSLVLPVVLSRRLVTGEVADDGAVERHERAMAEATPLPPLRPSPIRPTSIVVRAKAVQRVEQGGSLEGLGSAFVPTVRSRLLDQTDKRWSTTLACPLADAHRGGRF